MFAGIGTTSAETEAGGSRDALDVGQVPHAPAWILGAQPLVEPLIALRGVLAVALERAVKEEDAARGQDSRGAFEQRLGRRPGRDVDHVDVHDRVGVADGPGLALDVEQHRGRDVVGAGCGAPRADAVQVHRRRIRRLPAEGRQRAGEERRVLTGAARDLEDEATRRQRPPQHLQDRLAVSLGGGGVQAAVRDGLWVEGGHR